LLNAIESVLQQTFTDYELIVIDDGSTDDTRERLQPYMKCIRYFYQPNKGASAAQNAGIREARGEWVSILASDDTWLPTKLEKQFGALTALGDGFGACFTDCSFVGGEGDATGVTAFEEAGFKPDVVFGQIGNPIRLVLGRVAIFVQSLLVMRSLLNEVEGFDESLGLSEDRDLIVRLSFRTKFCFVSEPLVIVDRSPQVHRLTGLLTNKDDQAYEWLELPLKRWLAEPKLLDSETRQSIKDELIALYYGKVAERISAFRLVVALQSIREVHRMGLGYRKIFLTLLTRAGRKLVRPLS
jgi:glycosyltransferase involved in cell wall biosynthesis